MGFRLLLIHKYANWSSGPLALAGESEPGKVHARGGAWSQKRYLKSQDLCTELAGQLSRAVDRDSP